MALIILGSADGSFGGGGVAETLAQTLTAGNLTGGTPIDALADLALGTVSATSVTIGRAGQPVTIDGDLTINGTTTVVNATNLAVSDQLIIASAGADPGVNAGMAYERGATGPDAVFLWNETADQFELGFFDTVGGTVVPPALAGAYADLVVNNLTIASGASPVGWSAVLTTSPASGGTSPVVSDGDELLGASDGGWNIGQVGALRPDNVYAATSVVVGNSVTVTTGAVTGSAALDVAATGANDLTLTARGASTPFNDAGNTVLVGYTATSIIGALNEALAAATGGDTWAEVLANGPTSGTTDPVVEDTQELRGVDAASPGRLRLRGGNKTTAGGLGGQINVIGGDGGDGGIGADVFIRGGLTSNNLGSAGEVKSYGSRVELGTLAVTGGIVPRVELTTTPRLGPVLAQDGSIQLGDNTHRWSSVVAQNNLQVYEAADRNVIIGQIGMTVNRGGTGDYGFAGSNGDPNGTGLVFTGGDSLNSNNTGGDLTFNTGEGGPTGGAGGPFSVTTAQGGQTSGSGAGGLVSFATGGGGLPNGDGGDFTVSLGLGAGTGRDGFAQFSLGTTPDTITLRNRTIGAGPGGQIRFDGASTTTFHTVTSGGRLHLYSGIDLAGTGVGGGTLELWCGDTDTSASRIEMSPPGVTPPFSGGAIGIWGGDGVSDGIATVNAGDIHIEAGAAGNSPVRGGEIEIFGGLGGSNDAVSCRVIIQGGQNTGASGLGTGGAVIIQGGVGPNTVGQASGPVQITGGGSQQFGTANTTGGNVEITSGDGGTTTGNSGDVLIDVGSTVGGSRGVISIGSSGIRVTFPTGTRVDGIARISSGTAVTSAGAPHTVGLGQRLIYDPSGGTFTINAPGSPSIGDRFGIKNRSSSTTGVTVSGNGSNIEDPTASFSLAGSIASLSGDGISVEWEYDGTQWLVV